LKGYDRPLLALLELDEAALPEPFPMKTTIDNDHYNELLFQRKEASRRDRYQSLDRGLKALASQSLPAQRLQTRQ